MRWARWPDYALSAIAASALPEFSEHTGTLLPDRSGLLHTVNGFDPKYRCGVLGFPNELLASGLPKVWQYSAKTAAQSEFGGAWNLILIKDVLAETCEWIKVSMDLAGRENSTQSSKEYVDWWPRIFDK